MSNFENPFKDFVFSLPEDKLDLLIECINNRKDYDLYGVTAYDGKMVCVQSTIGVSVAVNRCVKIFDFLVIHL